MIWNRKGWIVCFYCMFSSILTVRTHKQEVELSQRSSSYFWFRTGSYNHSGFPFSICANSSRRSMSSGHMCSNVIGLNAFLHTLGPSLTCHLQLFEVHVAKLSKICGFLKEENETLRFWGFSIQNYKPAQLLRSSQEDLFCMPPSFQIQLEATLERASSVVTPSPERLAWLPPCVPFTIPVTILWLSDLLQLPRCFPFTRRQLPLH